MQFDVLITTQVTLTVSGVEAETPEQAFLLANASVGYANLLRNTTPRIDVNLPGEMFVEKIEYAGSQACGAYMKERLPEEDGSKPRHLVMDGRDIGRLLRTRWKPYVPRPDAELTPEQLEARYSPEGDGEHPVYLRGTWLLEVLTSNLTTGYWTWVLAKAQYDARDVPTSDNQMRSAA